jgi:tRNA A37 threonylcarbamoyladenosine dehydratase
VNWYARTEQLLGKEGWEALKRARVAVFGLGGVGSYAVEALARAGIGYLRIADFDVVNISNINRQLFALQSTLGKPKVEAARQRILDINPSCEVDGRNCFINAQSIDELLSPALDIVVDAIDSVSSKVSLIHAAREKGYAVVSSMGAGGRTAGAQIHAGDISESFNCPLARMIRKRIHRRGIYEGIRCVYSIEKARNKLPFKNEDVDRAEGRGRQRTPIGTISYMLGLFGLRVAEEVIAILLKKEVSP